MLSVLPRAPQPKPAVRSNLPNDLLATTYSDAVNDVPAKSTSPTATLGKYSQNA